MCKDDVRRVCRRRELRGGSESVGGTERDG